MYVPVYVFTILRCMFQRRRIVDKQPQCQYPQIRLLSMALLLNQHFVAIFCPVLLCGSHMFHCNILIMSWLQLHVPPLASHSFLFGDCHQSGS